MGRYVNWSNVREDTGRLGSAVVDLTKKYGPTVQKGVNAVGGFILPNLAVAIALDTGLDQAEQYVNLPDDAIFYGGLGLFNAGVMLPVYVDGAKNFVRGFFNKEEKREAPKPWHKHLKTAAAAGGLAALLATPAAREATMDIGERVFDSVSHEHTEVIQEDQEEKEDLGDHDLESAIQAYVDHLRTAGLARPRGVEDYSIYVKDLSSGEIIVDINSDRPQWAASEIKVFHAALFAMECENGRYDWDEYETNIEQMLHYGLSGVSRANRRTNEFLDLIGAERAQELLDKYDFNDTQLAKIPKSGRTTENYTSGRDMGRLLEMIANDEIPHAKEIRRIMEIGASDRLVQKTCIPVSSSNLDTHGGYVTEVADKTGYIYGANTNGAIISGKFKTPEGEVVDVEYVVNVMIQDKDAKSSGFRRGAWGSAKSEAIRSFSEAIWANFIRRYTGKPYMCSLHNGRHPQ